MEEDAPLPFRLFSTSRKPIAAAGTPTTRAAPSPEQASTAALPASPRRDSSAEPAAEIESEDSPSSSSSAATFASLGLAEWAVSTCARLGMKTPTAVQRRCIPRVLAGNDVVGVAQTGSGKTAAFALPILHCLSLNPYGVFAVVVTPTRELAKQLADQFRALGAALQLRCIVAIGGFNPLEQACALSKRPHVVIATPGRLRTLMEEDDDIAAVFAKTKFLVLDEADRVLDSNFEDDLRVIFKCLPRNRQTLLFSATMSDTLRTLLKISANKSYLFEAYEGFKTVESLKQWYFLMPRDGKEVFLHFILSKMKENEIRSAIVFVNSCRTCQYLDLLLDELGVSAVSLHSLKSQTLRLSSLHRFKSSQVPILLSTDVGSRGLDIDTVDLVINYDIPRYSQDYVHRVGRTGRAGRPGRAVTFLLKNEIYNLHEIEDAIGLKLEAYEYDERKAIEETSKVFKAKRIAQMKLADEGYEDKVQSRKDQKQRTSESKGLERKRSRNGKSKTPKVAKNNG